MSTSATALQDPPARPRKKRSFAWVTAIVLVAAVVGGLLGQRFEAPLADRVLGLAAPPPHPDVVVVAIDEETVADLPSRSPIDRAFLAELIATIDAKDPAALGVDLLFTRPTEAAKDEGLRNAIAAVNAPVVIASARQDEGLTAAQAAFAEGWPGTRGRAALPRDEADGIVRHLPLGNGTPPFSLALTTAAGQADAMPRGRILYAEGAFPTYSAKLVQQLPEAWFKDKVVLIGNTLPQVDRHQTPRIAIEGADKGEIPGVMLHAHIVSQILSGLSRQLPPAWLIALSALLAAIAGAALRPLAPLPAAAVGVTAILGYGAFCAGIVTLTPQLPPLATPPLAFVLAALGALGQRWRRDRRERIRVKGMFGRYVSPRVVQNLIDTEADPVLGGERREVTHLFTDLEGFTSLAETLEPERTAELLNSYLDGIVSLVHDAEGTVDKLVGDAVVAFFGAPDVQSDHAERAVACARKIAVFADKERTRRREEGVPLGRTRVGVHTGIAVVGNFGGNRFFDYTAVGDTVNVAARLESANRAVGTTVLVSAATRERASGAFRPVGRVLVKGRREPVMCYEPVASEDPHYSAAYEALKAGEDEATALFEALCEQFPDDGLIRLHAARSRAGKRDDIITTA
ncbi:MAG: adenylate/guanylate cyclase domain-containing protein [Devosia sp.]